MTTVAASIPVLRWAAQGARLCDEDLTARPIRLTVLRPDQTNRAAEVLGGKFYRDKAGNTLDMGLKVFP